jgi:hypothetical protein
MSKLQILFGGLKTSRPPRLHIAPFPALLAVTRYFLVWQSDFFYVKYPARLIVPDYSGSSSRREENCVFFEAYEKAAGSQSK